MTTEEKQTQHRQMKQRKQKRLKAKAAKQLKKKLLTLGETKHMHNLLMKSKGELKQALAKKNRQSIDFKGTAKFFQKLQESKE